MNTMYRRTYENPENAPFCDRPGCYEPGIRICIPCGEDALKKAGDVPEVNRWAYEEETPLCLEHTCPKHELSE